MVHDAGQISEVSHFPLHLEKLLKPLASGGQLELFKAKIARSVVVSETALTEYLKLMDMMFLTEELLSWGIGYFRKSRKEAQNPDFRHRPGVLPDGCLRREVATSRGTNNSELSLRLSLLKSSRNRGATTVVCYLGNQGFVQGTEYILPATSLWRHP